MDGSSIDFIVIPVVVLPLLALWLAAMFYAAARPQSRQQRPATDDVQPPAPRARSAPLQR